MATHIVDNSDEFLRDLGDIAPRRKFHVLGIENTMKYSLYLQAKHGYHVIDEEHAGNVIDRKLTPIINSDVPLGDLAFEELLESAATEIVDELQEFDGRLKPPVEKGRGNRPVHPGSWADITTELASNYHTRVNSRPRRQHEYNGEPQVSDLSKYTRPKSSPTI